jgi:hypothetical protein
VVHDGRMSDDEKPTERLVAQRARNRVMEEIWGLARGDLGVHEAGPTEWFETFFDWFPYEGEPEWYPAMTAEEEAAVRTVCKLMQLAVADAAIPKNPTIEQVIGSGWPERIAPFAQKALDVMLARGRFSEDEEEVEPSTPVPWP